MYVWTHPPDLSSGFVGGLTHSRAQFFVQSRMHVSKEFFEMLPSLMKVYSSTSLLNRRPTKLCKLSTTAFKFIPSCWSTSVPLGRALCAPTPSSFLPLTQVAKFSASCTASI